MVGHGQWSGMDNGRQDTLHMTQDRLLRRVCRTGTTLTGGAPSAPQEEADLLHYRNHSQFRTRSRPRPIVEADLPYRNHSNWRSLGDGGAPSAPLNRSAPHEEAGPPCTTGTTRLRTPAAQDRSC